MELEPDPLSMESWSAAMRHELGSTQRRILQLAEMIKRRIGDLDPEMTDAFAFLEDNARRGQNIAETLAEYVVLPEIDESVSFDAGELARTVVSVLTKERPSESEPPFELRLDDSQPLEIAGQPILLRAALDQTLRNAMTHGSGPVTLAVDREGDTIRLVVYAGGAHVDHNFLTRMRRPMQRGAKALAEAPGLGFTIIQRGVRRLGGELRLDPNEGGGVVTSLLLPAKGTAQAPRPGVPN